MTDPQTFYNVLIGLVAFLGGWVLNGLKDSIKTLHSMDSELSKGLQAVEVLVAGKYVSRDELEKLGNALFAKLDRIEHKMDGKADKEWCVQGHGVKV